MEIRKWMMTGGSPMTLIIFILENPMENPKMDDMGLPPVIIHFRISMGFSNIKNNQSHGATPSHHPFSDFPWDFPI